MHMNLKWIIACCHVKRQEALELQFQTPNALLEAIDRHAKANS